MSNDIIDAWAKSVEEQIEGNAEWLANGNAEDHGTYLGVVGLIRGLKESLDLFKDARDAKLKEQGEEE